MKRYFGLFVLVGLFGITLAQQSITGIISDNMLIPGKNNTIIQDIDSESINDLGSIQSMFCNNEKLTKELKLNMRPGQRKKICIILNNQSNVSIKLLFGFTEAVLNEDGVQTCQVDMSNKNIFSKSILNNPTTGILLPASGNIVQDFTYRAPKNKSGNVFGCFAYRIDKEEKIKEGNIFLIVPRKAGTIKINITGDVYNFGRRDDIKDIYIKNQSTILKIIICMLTIGLVVTIFQPSSKKRKNHTIKKQ